jgi:acetyltransferase-like isoleucine patch superfamily enzyme
MRKLLRFCKFAIYSYIKKTTIIGVKIESGVCLNRNTVLEDNLRIFKDTEIFNSKVGRGSYIGWSSVLNNVAIGRYCSIAPYTQVIYGAHPTSEFISSHPAFYSTQKQAGFTFCKEPLFNEFKHAKGSCYSVKIGNDVWIGHGVKILEGVTIGDGAIIGANSLVLKDVEPYSINVGMPTKLIKYRFKKELIDQLLTLKWWDFKFSFISQNYKKFSEPENFINSISKQITKGTTNGD